MKRIICTKILLAPLFLFAQSVAINTDESLPDNSALLDIKSESKGLLIPRLSTVQRTSITSPAIGLIVYDLNTFSFWYYAGDLYGGWLELQNSLQKHWERTASNVYNNNPGNIGIGTNNPTEKLAINATDPSIQFLNDGSPKGYVQAGGNDMRIGTYANNTSGRMILSSRGLDRVYINENGLVGIGTSALSALFTINGTNPIVQLRNGESNKGYLQVLNNDLKIGTNSTNTTGNLVFTTQLTNRMLINENGEVGIGTSNPSTILTINDANPTIQLRNAEVDKGFLQLSGDHLKIGTNLSNPTGKFIVRTNGSDRFCVDEEGNVGIGTSAPTSDLTINSSAPGIALHSSGVNHGGLTLNGYTMDLNKAAGGTLRIRANADGMWFYSTGQVSLGGGGAVASGHTLSVEGKIIAYDVTAAAFGAWPDYVFNGNYPLMNLPELKKYIAANKHLPNIPSAAEMEKKGIQLGDMTKRLMEKVEELTLYILQLQDQIDRIKNK